MLAGLTFTKGKREGQKPERHVPIERSSGIVEQSLHGKMLRVTWKRETKTGRRDAEKFVGSVFRRDPDVKWRTVVGRVQFSPAQDYAKSLNNR